MVQARQPSTEFRKVKEWSAPALGGREDSVETSVSVRGRWSVLKILCLKAGISKVWVF